MKKKQATALDVEEILEEHADMVYRIAFVQMKNKSEAEDVFQEVFLRLVTYIETIKGEEHVKPWLIRVTINCCKKQFSSAWRRKTASMEDQQFAEEVVVKDELSEDVLEACLSLPEAQRSVIHLFYFEGYSVREISLLLEQTESAVKTRLSRARDELRRKMKGDVFSER